MRHAVIPSLVAVVAFGCGDPLPEDVRDYRERCLKMNVAPIEPTADDPHEGHKDVFLCNLTAAEAAAQVAQPNYPDGTLIVKESTRLDEGQSFPWLIATMRKVDGTWRWNEYTRNFADQDFASIPAGESLCTACHRRVEARDWVYTPYQPQ